MDIGTKHQHKIARQSLKQSCVGARIGGMDHVEAARILNSGLPFECDCGSCPHGYANRNKSCGICHHDVDQCQFGSCQERTDLRPYKTRGLMCGDHVRLSLQLDGDVYSG